MFLSLIESGFQFQLFILFNMQEVSQQLQAQFNCHPVFLGAELKTNYYKSEKRYQLYIFFFFGKYLHFLSAPLAHNFFLLHFLPLEFCKQQLWPMMHYLMPLNPNSTGRFDPGLWSAYVRANMAFCSKLVEILGSLEDDFVWIHDYHLLVLPSLLRKRFHRLKCGFFLHSPFPHV